MMTVALAAIMCVGFMACSKDDNKEEADYSGLILGKWKKSSFNSQENIWEVQSIIEFTKGLTYSYENLTESIEGNYKVTETQRTDYLDITKSFLIVDSTVIYYEVPYDTDTDTAKAWKIVDGTIINIDGLSWPLGWPLKIGTHIYNDGIIYLDPPHYDESGRIILYTRDSTTIVSDTTYMDACFYKMLVSGSSDFDQLEVWYTFSKGYTPPYINLYFYSNNALVETTKWYARPRY